MNKISEVHGRKRPLIVEDSDKLEEIVEKMPSNSYTAKRTKLESFFRNLKPAERRQAVPAPIVPATAGPGATGARQNKIESRLAVTRSSVEVAPGCSLSITLQIVNVPLKLQTGRFVRVSKNPAFKECCDFKTGYSKVWSEASDMLFTVVLNNNTESNSKIPLGSELAVVTM